MKLPYAASSVLLAVVSTTVAAQPLAGVADKETTIAYGVDNFVRGKGDVLFVSDRADRWYRLALNDGCLDGVTIIRNVVFDSKGASRIDRFTTVIIRDNGVPRNCRAVSIRASEAPPQIDSKSPVTLD